MRAYTELAGFREVVLEESYVLRICASPGRVEIEIELALSPGHPEYEPPARDENECYRRGRIRFVGVQRLVWEDQGLAPAVDARGEVDYGHIDDFQWNGSVFELQGDWGTMNIVASNVRVDLG